MKKKIVWAISLVCFLSHQIAIKYNFSNQFLDSWIDPLLFIPVLIGGIEIFLKFLRNDFTLKPIIIYSFAAASVVLFEIIIPSFDNRFTSDVIDGFALFSGAFIYLKSN
tara:strand:+ start:126 stop:452 length:327 start_codon:yes stop_codon:yes gene_type:complete